MASKQKIHVGVIKTTAIKVRKKSAPPVQAHRSAKDYDRKRLKESTRKEATHPESTDE